MNFRLVSKGFKFNRNPIYSEGDECDFLVEKYARGKLCARGKSARDSNSPGTATNVGGFADFIFPAMCPQSEPFQRLEGHYEDSHQTDVLYKLEVCKQTF